MDNELITPYGLDAHDPILRLPKVSLHDHLDGAVRPGTIIELAAAVGHELPAADAEGLRAKFSGDAVSGDLVAYLATFDHILAVLQTPEALTRVAYEWVLDQVADGVFYAEARWAPEQHGVNGMDLDAAIEAVQAGLDKGVAKAAELGRVIRVGQLVTAMRQADRSLEVAQAAVRHRDSGVVGFDIAGPELGFPADAHLAAFDHLHRENFPVTIHAGEADGLDSIFSAVQICHAQRIGHGTRIIDDVPADGDREGMGRLAAWVLDHQIPLELCPSSNIQTGAATSIAEHPITALKDQGFAVTINPDNRLLSATSVSREMRLLADHAGWTQDDFEFATVTALGSAFIPLQERERLIDEILIPGFESIDI